MDQFNFNSFPETNFNEVNLSWMLEVMSQFKEDLESGQFVGPQGPQGPKGDPGPAGDGITEEVKQALLQLARKVAYIDNQGQTYYQDLYNALYGTTPAELVSISAAYTQSGTVYDTDSLDSLKADLIVTATYSDSSTAIIPAADYTLSGSLTVGTSTITVSYQGKTATFQVTVTASAVTLVSISAAFNQGSAVIYESDSLDTLKQYLAVTASYSDSTTATIPSTDYTLSGTLSAGISTITVSYRGKTDTFQVTVTADPVMPVSISAAYTQSGAVYDTDSLNSLKADLIVTATYSDSSTAIVPSADYTLSGTLTPGVSTVTASYGGLTATFSVTVTHNTTAQVYKSGYVLEHLNNPDRINEKSMSNGGITIMYDMDAPTTTLNVRGIVPYTGTTFANGYSALVCYDSNNAYTAFVNMNTSTASNPNRWAQLAGGTMTEYGQSWTVPEFTKIQFSVDARYLDDAYLYDGATGQVWFAGRNTPYFGMSNVSEAQ